MIGTSVAHYRITSKIGEGGMGEVYQASDTKLGRNVALKLLPSAFATDSQRMGRFSREARVLASLNHPNIAAIYGLEELEGKRVLVMELVEGEDLSERIRRGPMPLHGALKIALQIAEALESAHEKGIIHRDLKPANVKLTLEDKVKVLDFGLAKALEGDPEDRSAELSQSPTLSLAATQAGIILGTAGYMSPEQARGQSVDQRADVWAFGVILFEMLTGKVAFTGQTLSDVLASVLKVDLDWKTLPEQTPPPVLRLLKRCLQGDPKRRLHNIADARIEIDEYLANPMAESITAAQKPGTTAVGRSRALVVSGLLTAAAASFFAGWLLKPEPEPPPPPSPIRVEAAMPGELAFFVEAANAAALSPDGRRLAYVTGTATVNTRKLHLRPLDRLEGTELQETEGSYNPFFSPDGQWVGFVTPTELKKVSVSGGTPLTLCGVNLSRGATWGETGLIVLAPNPSSGLQSISAAGGEPNPVTQLVEGEVSHRWPQFLPGGKRVLFTTFRSNDRNTGKFEVVNLETGERKVVHQGGTYARYAASGHLLYVNNGTLFAAPFDLDTLELQTLPAPVLQGLTANPEGGAQYDISSQGTLSYLTGTAEGAKRTLVSKGLRESPVPITETRKEYLNIRLSPDGRKLALEIFAESNRDIWVHDMERDTQTRLTFEESIDQFPIWSNDGRYVFFSSNRDGKQGIFRKRADGSGQAERLTESPNAQSAYSVSPDGRFLAFHEQTQDGYDTWILRMGDNLDQVEPEVLLNSPFNEADPVISPDGRWLAYESDESGRWEVYVRPFPDPGGKWQVSSDGGEYARWSADGKKLFFLRGNSVWQVTVTAGSESFQVGRPEKLFDLQGTFQSDWDITPDGRQFYFVQDSLQGVQGGPNLLKLTFNWFEELRQLLETAR